MSSAPTAVCGAPQPLHRAGPLPEHGGARGPGGSVSSPLNRLSRLYPAPHPPLLWSCRATTGQTSVEGQATSSSSTPQRRTGKVRLPLRRARRCWGQGGAPRPTEAWTRLALVPSPPALSGSELPSQCCWLTVGGRRWGTGGPHSKPAPGHPGCLSEWVLCVQVVGPPPRRGASFRGRAQHLRALQGQCPSNSLTRR